jgi:hypothetical protein
MTLVGHHSIMRPEDWHRFLLGCQPITTAGARRLRGTAGGLQSMRLSAGRVQAELAPSSDEPLTRVLATGAHQVGILRSCGNQLGESIPCGSLRVATTWSRGNLVHNGCSRL